MPETGGSLINSALKEIYAQGSEAPVEPDEAQDAISYLNRMMATKSFLGLGYTTISGLGDVITVPDGAILGIIKNLALILQPQFGVPGKPINSALIAQAKEGRADILALTINRIGPTLFPDTLPIGSGNEDTSSAGLNDPFYGQPDEPILTEQGAFISVEQNTDLPNAP